MIDPQYPVAHAVPEIRPRSAGVEICGGTELVNTPASSEKTTPSAMRIAPAHR